MGLLKDYKSSLKLLEVEEVIELFFYRPLAFLFVKLIYSTNITPNQVTLLGLVFGVAGGITLASNNPEHMPIVALLFIIFNVLDCSDGQLARLKGNGTPFGRILDGMADYMVSLSAYLGIGFSFANNTDSPLLYWGLLVCAAASNIVHAALVDYYRNRFLDYTQDRKAVLNDSLDGFKKEYEALKTKKGRFFEKFVIKTYLKYSTMQSGLAITESKKQTVSAEAYYKKNKTIIHFWTYLGPATLWTFLTVCIVFNTLNIYLWSLVTIFNVYALIIYFIQKRIDKSLGIK